MQNRVYTTIDLFIRKRKILALYRDFVNAIPREFNSFVMVESQNNNLSFFKVILNSKVEAFNPRMYSYNKIELAYKEIQMLCTNENETPYIRTTASFYKLITIMEESAKLLNTSAIKLYGDLYAELKIYEDKEFDILNGD